VGCELGVPEHRAAADRAEIIVDPPPGPRAAAPAGALARNRFDCRLRPIGRYREYATAAALAFQPTAGGDEVRCARDGYSELTAGAGGNTRHELILPVLRPSVDERGPRAQGASLIRRACPAVTAVGGSQ